jgi:serine/threonine protein kinase
LGVAKIFIPSQEQPFLFHQCGTPSFIAPEILRGEGYTTKADIFSVGCLFFNILTGLPPFKGNTTDEIIIENKECDLSMLFSKTSVNFSP